jgi:hypothetical protein
VEEKIHNFIGIRMFLKNCHSFLKNNSKSYLCNTYKVDAGASDDSIFRTNYYIGADNLFRTKKYNREGNFK